jgi:hypothetical protein
MKICSMGLVTIFPVQLLIGLNLMAEHQPMPPSAKCLLDLGMDVNRNRYYRACMGLLWPEKECDTSVSSSNDTDTTTELHFLPYYPNVQPVAQVDIHSL